MNRIIVRITFLIAVLVFSASLLSAAEKEGGTPAATQNQGEVKKAPAQPSQAAAQAFKSGIRASQVIGKSVIDTKGAKLGKVEDLVLSKDGCAEYITLAHGGFLGIGNKLIPIPWKSVETGTQSDVLIVNASKADLKNAPKFEAERWPDFGNPEWRKKIFNFFGVQSGNEKTKNQ
jgi:sporulation protein YlmC with PRC-barrel domain